MHNVPMCSSIGNQLAALEVLTDQKTKGVITVKTPALGKTCKSTTERALCISGVCVRVHVCGAMYVYACMHIRLPCCLFARVCTDQWVHTSVSVFARAQAL